MMVHSFLAAGDQAEHQHDRRDDRKMKNKAFATSAALLATPPTPNTAAMIATTKQMAA
jgi:hypothetical protein